MNVLINIFGPSTAGKSTVAGLLQERIEGLQLVDFDVIKRQIPDYDWQKHAQIGRDMTIDALAGALEGNTPILLLYPPAKDEAEFKRLNSLTEAHGYKMLNIEITAPKEVLIARYEHRLANVDPTKKGWKFKTLDEFKTKLEELYYKPQDTASFDTSQKNPDEIVNAVMELLTS